MKKINEIEQLRSECWDLALYAFGTSYIFSERALKLKKNIGCINYFGIVVPLTIGGVAIGYGVNSKLLVILIPIAAFLSVIQLIVFTWAIIKKWDEELSYSYESATANKLLADEFECLAKYDHNTEESLSFFSKYQFLKAKNQSREEQDSKHSIIGHELRKGMRYALRNYKRECTGCKNIPISMKSTNCDVCGNFKNYRK